VSPRGGSRAPRCPSLLRADRGHVPKRADLRSVLIVGSGPIRIGQGCEFDYAGAQACRVLGREGYRVVLVNSNPATIMTDPEWADATYLEPLDAETLEQVIAVERPDALLPTLGGQTALNLALELHEAGVLDRSIENLDPMGVHTGDSWTVAPQQTLPDAEFQRLREAAFACARAVGVATGGANVQFAYEPQTRELVVIEMNPRVSRSSALASKATGFPIAKLAALLAVGYTLDELPNDI